MFLCALVGWCACIKRLFRTYNWYTCSISFIKQEFHTACNRDKPAGKQYCNGYGRCRQVFDLCDEVPETDEGDVELVNICYDSNGEIHETEELTEMWAWKKPNAANKDEMYTRLQGDVTFDGVDFGYNPDKIVLHDIKMFAKPGQKLAFVGSTGAGKTTITNLINRFYDIQDGKIRYDGININHIKKRRFTPKPGHCFTGYQPFYRHDYGQYQIWKTQCS